MHIKHSKRIVPIVDDNGGAFFELSGQSSGGSYQHSVTEVVLPPESALVRHLHPTLEESLYVISGHPRVMLNGTSVQLNTGDLVAVPPQLVHSLSNGDEEVALLLSVNSPPWSADETTMAAPVRQREDEMHIKNAGEITVVRTTHGELITELSGKSVGGTKQHSVAHITLEVGKSSLKHYHPEVEESYYVLSGKGRMLIDEEERRVEAGDLIAIPPNSVHQIANNSQAELIFLAICTPPWTPDCSVFVD